MLLSLEKFMLLMKYTLSHCIFAIFLLYLSLILFFSYFLIISLILCFMHDIRDDSPYLIVCASRYLNGRILRIL
jgi:hypothetical protein